MAPAIQQAAQAILAHRRKYTMLGQVSGNWYRLELGRLEGALYEALAAKPKK